jgi:competence ComEA-like helix-hairpin-helix protein
MNTNNSPDPIVRPLFAPIRRIASIVALCALVATLTATWLHSAPADARPTSSKVKAPAQEAAPEADTDADADEAPAKKPKAAKKSKGKQALAGKLNLNTATAEQLQLLPGVGAEKAERVVTWRTKNGGFKRIADLRKVKGFGYKTIKKLEKYLDVNGDNTLAAK